MSDELFEPGHTYIGKDGKERALIDRGEPTTDGGFNVRTDGMTFRWRGRGHKLRQCWISTWMEWVKARKS